MTYHPLIYLCLASLLFSACIATGCEGLGISSPLSSTESSASPLDTAHANAPKLEDILAMNQRGQWQEAASSAARLGDDPNLPARERLGAHLALALAELMQGKHQQAHAALARFDAQAHTLANSDWHHHEAERIRAALLGEGPYASKYP